MPRCSQKLQNHFGGDFKKIFFFKLNVEIEQEGEEVRPLAFVGGNWQYFPDQSYKNLLIFISIILQLLYFLMVELFV